MFWNQVSLKPISSSIWCRSWIHSWTGSFRNVFFLDCFEDQENNLNGIKQLWTILVFSVILTLVFILLPSLPSFLLSLILYFYCSLDYNFRISHGSEAISSFNPSSSWSSLLAHATNEDTGHRRRMRQLTLLGQFAYYFTVAWQMSFVLKMEHKTKVPYSPWAW